MGVDGMLIGPAGLTGEEATGTVGLVVLTGTAGGVVIGLAPTGTAGVAPGAAGVIGAGIAGVSLGEAGLLGT